MRVLITGATSGIGRQLALDYHRQGHQVWALGRNSQALATLAELGLHTVKLELTDRQATLDWFAQMGPLDLVVLNAGSCEYVDVPPFDSALFARVMATNVLSMTTCIEGVLPCLAQGTRPHLVGMSSSSAYLPLPRAEAYGASKAAIRYLMETLYITLKPQGITVSCVFPGFVDTPLTARNDFPMPMQVSVEKAAKAIRQGIAKRRFEIRFPGFFTGLLKLLRYLPRRLWRHFAQGMIRT